MRILHVIAGIPAEGGGPTHVLREMSARLAELGHDVRVLTTDSGGHGRRVGDMDHGFAPGVKVELYAAQMRRSPHPSIGHSLALWRAAKACDVAHVHGVFALPVSLAMAAFRARGVPYVLRPCGMLDAYSLSQKPGAKRAWLSMVERANLEAAARVQASTEHEAAAVRALVSNGEKVVVLPQGVATPGAASGRRLHDRPYLLFLSRVARKKGLPLLVEAFARLAAERPALDLVLVGPDERGHEAEVRRTVSALGLSERVRFAGAAGPDEKTDWYAGAEAFVLPSADENFGVVVVEAAHLGVPVVVSGQVGLAPTVVQLGAGVVVAREVEALAAGIRTVLGGRSAYARGLAALAEMHDWAPLATRVEALYREAIGG